jgi:uncharacterized protein involved in exopolysaccharide biosynthesis
LEQSALPTQDPASRVDVLGALSRYWKTIALWTAVVTVAAAAVSMVLSKTYQAEAVVLINPSPYKSSSLEQSPLDVDIYEKMLRSPALIEEVRAFLKLDDMSVEKLLKKIHLGLTKRTSQRETTYAPMLLLQVEDRSPALCQAIANAWADLATSASLRIKGAVIKQANERIRAQWKDTKDLLENKENDLKKFDATAQLIEKKAELEIVRTQLASEQDNLESLRLQYSVAVTRLADLKKKYASFFVNGVWVGSLHVGEKGSSVTIAQLAASTASVGALPLQFFLARNDLVDKTQKYTNFKVKERVDITKRQYDILINKILRFEQDVEDMKISLATQKAKLQSLESSITTVPERLMVKKAITDEALWMALVSRSRSLDDVTSKRMTSEEINPIWLSMMGRIQYVRPEIASIEARIKSHEELLTKLRDEQTTLNEVVVVQTQESQNLESEMRLAKERYETLFQQYLQISRDIMLQESETARFQEEITNSQRQVERLTSATISLTSYTVTGELDRERLHRDLTSVKNIFTTLATKNEEARITELEVSGDLQVAFRAVKPEDKIRPKRAQIIGAAFLCALAFFSLLAVAREQVRQQGWKA